MVLMLVQITNINKAIQQIDFLKSDLKQFEKYYNIEYNKYLIGAEFSNMVDACDKYNNMIAIIDITNEII